MSTRSLSFQCSCPESAATLDVLEAVSSALSAIESHRGDFDNICRKNEVEKVLRALNRLYINLQDDIVYGISPTITKSE